MCQAYTIAKNAAEIEDFFKVVTDEQFRARYNARPAQLLPVITQENPSGLSYFYWGTTPSRSKRKPIAEKLYNVNSEIVNEFISYKAALQSKRCVVPADGFYAWKTVSKKGQIPYRFNITNAILFGLAGLWEEFETEQGEVAHTFTILTTSANAVAASTGTRMPVILNESGISQWLDKSLNSPPLDLLAPYDSMAMAGYAVSSRVNNPELDIPELIDPAPAADQFGNYSLFD